MELVEFLSEVSKYLSGNQLLAALFLWALVHYVFHPFGGLVLEVRKAVTPTPKEEGSLSFADYVTGFLESFLEALRLRTEASKDIETALRAIEKALLREE
jgi:hypothetical protein